MSFRLKSAMTLAACVAFGSSALAQDPQSLTIATASPGGVYAVYGEGVAAVISKAVGIKTSTRQTQGPVQNLVLVEAGRAPLGMTTSGPAYEALQEIGRAS